MSVLDRILFPKKKTNLVKVYSHPRSGTHFLEAFIAKNFYPNKDLMVPLVTWGHWANRSVNENGNPYGKLFGSHYFPYRIQEQGPKVYIARDGRAVAYSIWKTPNFLHPDLKGISFSDFLRTPLDWQGSPASKTDAKRTIFEHWDLHLQRWMAFAENKPDVLITTYESLVDDPFTVYSNIHTAFFANSAMLSKAELDPIKKAVGLLPNKAVKNSWEDSFTNEDQEYFEKMSTNQLYN